MPSSIGGLADPGRFSRKARPFPRQLQKREMKFWAGNIDNTETSTYSTNVKFCPSGRLLVAPRSLLDECLPAAPG